MYVPKGFIGPKTAAEILGVKVVEVIRFVKVNKLREFRQAGSLYYKETEVRALRQALDQTAAESQK